jgi:hypothetical protein
MSSRPNLIQIVGGLVVCFVVIAAWLTLRSFRGHEAATDTSVEQPPAFDTDGGYVQLGPNPPYVPLGPDPGGDPGMRPPPERSAALTLAARKFRSLPVIYFHPNELPFGRSTEFALVIASSDLRAAEADIANYAGEKKKAQVKLSSQVRAELTGPPSDVDITPQGPSEIRDVSGVSNVKWRWAVTPKRPGDTALTLQLYNVVQLPDGAGTVEGPGYRDEIHVKMTAWQATKYAVTETESVRISVIATITALAGTLAWLWRRRVAPETARSSRKPRPRT